MKEKRKNKWTLVKEQNMRMAEELLNKYYNDESLYLHHKAMSQDKCNRTGGGYATQYSGKYGEGYAVHIPNFMHHKYHDVYYFIKKEDD